MTGPIRVQRKRVRGWKMPPNTVYVGRPSDYGNPWTIRRHESGWWFVFGPMTPIGGIRCSNESGARRVAVDMYHREALRLGVSSALRGKNLACWCPLDQPCHADVLLEIANAPRCEEPPLTTTHGPHK